MLDDVEVLIGPLEPPKSGGTLVGGFEIRVGNTTFPGEGWSDFVLPVIGWIAGALATARSSGAASAPFMDGAFTLRFEVVGNEVHATGLVPRPGMSDRRVLDARSSWNQWNVALDLACSEIIAKLSQLGFARDSETGLAVVEIQSTLDVA